MENTFGVNITPENDKERIAALKRYKISGTPSEHSFDNIALLATQIFKVPISLISLVDEDEVFFKANIGMGNATSTTRGVSLCSLAIMKPEVTVFENAQIEPCLLVNPNVAGEFGLQFYAGAPLITPEGHRIGTLCIIDKKPRKFSKEEEKILEGLARVVIDEIELRLSSIEEISKQVDSLHNIQEIEERARLAIDAAQIGTYDIDLLTNKLVMSDRFKEIFGLDGNATRSQLIKKYHPDDMGIRDKALDEALKNGNSNYQIRLLFDNGDIKWLKCDGRVFYNKDKKPVRLVGTALDISSTIEIQKQKDDFLAIASHELKTPLTSIKAYIQIVSELVKKGDEVTTLNILKKAERQVTKMTGLIHNFLDISKLESSQLQLNKESFDLNDHISDTINYYNIPENKEFLFFERGDIPLVFADKSKIGNVIDNLINNALKYSANKQPVLIKTGIAAGEITFSVKDSGKGINDSSKKKIFQRFYRADNVKNDSQSGFGIGLYFASEIIALHKGNIWFDSVEGEGSTFFFSLPVMG